MNKPAADFREQQLAFAKHLRDPARFPAPAGIEDRRLKIYRELFFNNMQSLLAGTFPVLHRILGSEQWTALVRHFYRDHVSHTPLFMEVPQEFLAWLASEYTNDGSWPEFMPELAHYEWLELAVSIDPREIDDEEFDAEGNILTGIPVISPVARHAAYRFPVHRIRPGFQPAVPDEQPTFLVVYRRRDDSVGFTEINAVTARLLELIGEENDRSGEALLQQIAAEMCHPNPTVVVDGGRELLEQLKSNDIVLGTRP